MASRVSVFFLGGTISMVGSTGGMVGSTGGGVVSRLGATELLAPIADLLGPDVEVSGRDVTRLPSAALTVPDVVAVLDAAREAVVDGADGVVVVQGTDTIEETAYLLDLCWDAAAPIVITGAMRHPGLPGADGPANLLDAITVATAPACRDLGALVVLGGEAHAARYVAKRHTALPSAFVSPNCGPLVQLVEGMPRLMLVPRRLSALAAPRGPVAAVALVVATLGDDGALLIGLAERFAGLVVAGMGGGHVPESWVPRLAQLADEMPVVLASRAGAGPVLTGTYAAPGAEIDLIDRGLIPAGMLDPLKARILLAVLFGGGADRAEIAVAFAARATG